MPNVSRQRLQLFAYIFLTFMAIVAVGVYDAKERGKLRERVVVIEQTIEGEAGARGRPGMSANGATTPPQTVTVQRTVTVVQRPVIERQTVTVNRPIPGPPGPRGEPGAPGGTFAGPNGNDGGRGAPGTQGLPGVDGVAPEVDEDEIADEVTDRVLDEVNGRLDELVAKEVKDAVQSIEDEVVDRVCDLLPGDLC